MVDNENEIQRTKTAGHINTYEEKEPIHRLTNVVEETS